LDIILASTSKIRRNILSNAGIEFSVIDSEFDEAAAKNSISELPPRDLALELAKLKSQKISRYLDSGIRYSINRLRGPMPKNSC
jgi:septum formation protein